MKSPLSFTQRQAGFSLVEVTIALGVAGFCLLAIFGLLPVGLNSNRISVEQSDAANIAIGVIADIKATPLTSQLSPRYKFPVPVPGGTADPTPQTLYFTQEGTAVGTVGSSGGSAGVGSVYRVTLGYGTPVNTKAAIPVRVQVTWPAQGDTRSTWPVLFSGLFETQVAINRN